MKIFVLTFMIAHLLLVAPAQAESAWGDLSAWVGKYPTSEESGKSRRILDNPGIRKALNKLLSAVDRRMLASLTNESKIDEKDTFILIDLCKPHNCPAQRATIVLDTKSERLWVGYFERRSESVSTRWYGNIDDYVVLPESVLKRFRERHGD